MDQEWPKTHELFRERFHDLVAQIDCIHEEWQEAVSGQDLDRQSSLIAREHGVLTEAHAIIVAFRESVLQRRKPGRGADFGNRTAC